jgi:hypothetical protein
MGNYHYISIQHILKYTGFKLKLETKDLNDDLYDVINNKDNIKEEDKEEDKQDIKSYENIKKEFEKKNFKINNPCNFAEITIENKLVLRSVTEFQIRYKNLKYEKEVLSRACQIEIKEVSFIDEWLQDKEIRHYERIDCLPKQECPTYIYNSFDGFKVEKVESNEIDITKSKIYDHLYNLCGREEKVLNYVLMYLSRKLKNPDLLTNTALIFKSVQGVGKNIFFDWFGNEILGNKYYISTQDVNLLFGQFNPSLANKILVVIDEISYVETIQLISKLKAHITQPINMINEKGAKVYENKNHIGYIMFTNDENPIKIEVTDRRYLAIQCIPDYANNNEYISNILKEMRDKRYSRAFYDYLIKLESEYYDFTNSRPTTAYNEELKEANIPIVSKFLEDLIYSEIKKNDNMNYTASELFNEYKCYLEHNNFNKNMTTSTSFGIQLNKYKSVIKKRTDDGNKYNINFKMLKEELIIMKHMKPADNEEVDLPLDKFLKLKKRIL